MLGSTAMGKPACLNHPHADAVQLFITVGILAAGCINYGTDYIHPWGWRLSAGLAGEISASNTFMQATLPCSNSVKACVQAG